MMKSSRLMTKVKKNQEEVKHIKRKRTAMCASFNAHLTHACVNLTRACVGKVKHYDDKTTILYIRYMVKV